MKREKGKEGMEINGPSKVLEFLTDSKMPPPAPSNPSFLHELLGLANPMGMYSLEIIVAGKLPFC